MTTHDSSEGEGGCPSAQEQQSRGKDLTEVGEGKRAREGPRRLVHHQEATRGHCNSDPSFRCCAHPIT